MKVYYNDSFTGYYPVGTSAVVFAETAEEAAAKLVLELARIGLSQEIKPEDMTELLPERSVVIINDGNY